MFDHFLVIFIHKIQHIERQDRILSKNKGKFSTFWVTKRKPVCMVYQLSNREVLDNLTSKNRMKRCHFNSKSLLCSWIIHKSLFLEMESHRTFTRCVVYESVRSEDLMGLSYPKWSLWGDFRPLDYFCGIWGTYGVTIPKLKPLGGLPDFLIISVASKELMVIIPKVKPLGRLQISWQFPDFLIAMLLFPFFIVDR